MRDLRLLLPIVLLVARADMVLPRHTRHQLELDTECQVSRPDSCLPLGMGFVTGAGRH
jgi:hypothetical protein